METPNYRDIKRIKIIGWTMNTNPDQEKMVNTLLAVGWQLLTLQPGSEHQSPSFTLGWAGDGEPKKTDWEIEMEERYESYKSMETKTIR